MHTTRERARLTFLKSFESVLTSGPPPPFRFPAAFSSARTLALVSPSLSPLPSPSPERHPNRLVSYAPFPSIVFKFVNHCGKSILFGATNQLKPILSPSSPSYLLPKVISNPLLCTPLRISPPSPVGEYPHLCSVPETKGHLYMPSPIKCTSTDYQEPAFNFLFEKYFFGFF